MPNVETAKQSDPQKPGGVETAIELVRASIDMSRNLTANVRLLADRLFGETPEGPATATNDGPDEPGEIALLVRVIMDLRAQLYQLEGEIKRLSGF